MNDNDSGFDVMLKLFLVVACLALIIWLQWKMYNTCMEVTGGKSSFFCAMAVSN